MNFSVYMKAFDEYLDQIDKSNAMNEAAHQEQIFNLALHVKNLTNSRTITKDQAKKLGAIIKTHEFYIYESGMDKHPEIFGDVYKEKEENENNKGRSN